MNRTDRTIEWLKNNQILSVIIIAAVVIGGVVGTLKDVTELADFFGFNKHNTVPSKTSPDTTYATIPPAEVEAIVLSLLREKPEFYGYQNIYGKNYMLTYTGHNKQFKLFKELNGLWEEVQSVDTLGDYLYSPAYDEWKFITIDSLPALYFTDHSFGNVFGSMYFNLLRFQNDYTGILYTLEVGGSYANEGGVAMFDNTDYQIFRNEAAKKEDNFSRYLEIKLKESNVIEPLTAADIDLDNPKNAFRQWEITNAQLLNLFSDEEDSSKYQKDDLAFKFKYHKADFAREFSAGIDTIENDNYILFDIFKLGCVIKEKATGNYFVALAHENLNIWPVKLMDNKLFVGDDIWFGKPFTIDLRTGKIKFVEAMNSN